LAQYYKEGFLLQLIFYAGFWAVDEYAGLLICTIMAIVIGGLFLFSLVVELVQKSKVPKGFFYWMGLSALAPIIIAVGFTLLFQGDFNWLKD
jgi:hypothetical protein